MKRLSKVLSFMLVLSLALSVISVSAAEFTSGKHEDTSVVNIKGRIAAEDIVGGEVVTVSIIENLGLESERVAHVAELKVNAAGMFESKFVCEATDNSVLKVCYNGEVVNDALIEADINGVNKLMNVQIVILSDRGGAFNQKDWGEMPEYSYADESANINATYQSEYTFAETTGVSAFVKVENTYGLDESFTPIIACYGENNKLLGTKIFDVNNVAFDAKTAVSQTEIVDLPEGTIRAKAFAWDKDKLIPFGDSNEGELDKINVILVGASTAQTWPESYYPEEGFGKFLGDYFNPDYVTYYNKSVSGGSTTTYLDDDTKLGYWPDVVKLVQPGSIVIIELGGNDRSKTVDENGNFSPEKFKANLLTMYNDVVAKGGKVVFAGVTADSGTVSDGKFVFSSSRKMVTDYKEEFAKLTGSDFITCEQDIIDFYNTEITRLGSVDEVRGYYFRIGEYLTKPVSEGGFGITTENYGYAVSDTTHTNVRGADVVAQKFYEAIVKSDSILKAYTK